MRLRKIFKLAYYYFLTLVFYKAFIKKAGKRFVIIDPILFTPQYLSVGNNVVIRNNARVEGVSRYESQSFHPEIVIGNDVKIQQNLHLTCASKIEIGDNTAIAANVTITDIDHGYENINIPPERQPLKVTSIHIGANCKIYNNAVLLPGTILGDHVIAGANSVIKGTFPDYCVIAGAPAKILKRYNAQKGIWEKTDEKGNFIV